MAAPDLVAAWPVRHAAAGALALPAGAAWPGAGPAEVLFTTGPPRHRFAWASLTKLCTALAVWVAVEERTVDPADPAGPPGSTLAHLLAHASGLGPAGGVRGAPGTRRLYSNEGYEEAGRHLARRAAMPYPRYLREAVLEPLGMTGVVVPEAGAASASLSGTLDDLSALAAELLSPTLVAPATLIRATAVAFPGLDGVLPGFGLQRPCDWGTGPERRGAKDPHWTGRANSPATFGHFGQAGGLCWVDPVARVAAVALTDRDFGPWARRAWPAFADAVLADAAGRPH